MLSLLRYWLIRQQNTLRFFTLRLRQYGTTKNAKPSQWKRVQTHTHTYVGIIFIRFIFEVVGCIGCSTNSIKSTICKENLDPSSSSWATMLDTAFTNYRWIKGLNLYMCGRGKYSEMFL
jgi:hypothetical protein